MLFGQQNCGVFKKFSWISVFRRYNFCRVSGPIHHRRGETIAFEIVRTPAHSSVDDTISNDINHETRGIHGHLGHVNIHARSNVRVVRKHCSLKTASYTTTISGRFLMRESITRYLERSPGTSSVRVLFSLPPLSPPPRSFSTSIGHLIELRQ